MEFEIICITTYSKAGNSRADCVINLLSKISPDRRVLIFDDGSDDPKLLEFLRDISGPGTDVFFSSQNRGPEYNNARSISYCFNRNLSPWLLLDDDVSFSDPEWLEKLEAQLTPEKPLLYYLHFNYCYGVLISGTTEMIRNVGSFDLKRFDGLPYGLCHLDFQERCRRMGYGKLIEGVQFELCEVETANPEMQKECRKRYDKYQGIINNTRRGFIPDTILDE